MIYILCKYAPTTEGAGEDKEQTKKTSYAPMPYKYRRTKQIEKPMLIL